MKRWNRTRRHLLVVGATAVLGGCATDPNDSTDGPDTDLSGSSTAQTDCSLNHTVLDDDREHDVTDRYKYEALSSTAQQYFDGAREDPDSDYEVEQTDESAPEYHYTDVVTKYEIVYDDEVYVLGTWSGEGCRIDG